MKILKSYIILALLVLATFTVNAQARLTIKNNSMRSMTVKVMKGFGEGKLYKTVTISAYSSGTIYFSRSGYYFTKTKAVVNGREPVYQKGQPFEVVNDDTGYSVLTLTFSITESAVPQLTGGRQISQQEFEMN